MRKDEEKEMAVWKPIQGYEGLYEMNEKAEIRRIEGNGRDGRKVSEHAICSSRAQNGMRYVSLWKDGKRRSHMHHKLYAAAFHISENEAARRLYYGFHGKKEAADHVRGYLRQLCEQLEKQEQEGADCHDELLYLQAFLEELDHDQVMGVPQAKR